MIIKFSFPGNLIGCMRSFALAFFPVVAINQICPHNWGKNINYINTSKISFKTG
jgi:hypothetical protein